MKLKIMTAALVIVVSTIAMAFAQKPAPFIGITGGISFPLGNWGKADYIVSTTSFANDLAGYAGTGQWIGIEGAYFFSKYVGVGALFNYGSNKTKDIDSLSGGYRESFDVDQVTTTAGSWKVLDFMPGLYFNFPVYQKLAVTARALAGITSASTPLITVDVEDGGIDDGTFTQESSSKTAFGFDIGAGLSYPVIKSLLIQLNGDFSYSKPDFTITNTQRMNTAGRLITEYNQPLEAMNISLGVAYQFGN